MKFNNCNYRYSFKLLFLIFPSPPDQNQFNFENFLFIIISSSSTFPGILGNYLYKKIHGFLGVVQFVPLIFRCARIFCPLFYRRGLTKVSHAVPQPPSMYRIVSKRNRGCNLFQVPCWLAWARTAEHSWSVLLLWGCVTLLTAPVALDPPVPIIITASGSVVDWNTIKWFPEPDGTSERRTFVHTMLEPSVTSSGIFWFPNSRHGLLSQAGETIPWVALDGRVVGLRKRRREESGFEMPSWFHTVVSWLTAAQIE